MPDNRYINDIGTPIRLPSSYDNYYRQLILPYDFQNILTGLVEGNANLINMKIKSGIVGTPHLMRAISKEYFPDEVDATFEMDVVREYGELMQQFYGYGNWDLRIDPGVHISGDFANAGVSILHPQCGLFWNSFYSKYFAVWYTQIQAYNNYAVISKEDAEDYIRNTLSKTSDYVSNDEYGIILRATKELGFSPIDVLSVNENPTPRVQLLLDGLPYWSAALNQAQLTYKALKQFGENPNIAKNYTFLDEDTSLFSPLRRSYFVFKVENNYLDDLTGTSELTTLPEYWTASKAYKVGDYVLGSGEKDKDFIYRCGQTHTAEEGKTFQQKVTIKKKNNDTGEITEQIIDRWIMVSDDFAEEIKAIKKFKPNFNPKGYVRFVFPELEYPRRMEYYTNGEPRPSAQYGRVYWGGPSGITLRPIEHKYIKEEDQQKADEYNQGKPEEEQIKPKVSTKIDYLNVAISTLDETDPSDLYMLKQNETIDPMFEESTPSYSDVTFYDSGRKLIHYFSGGATVYLIVECKIEEIKEEAFANRQDLLKIVCRSGLKSIGEEAFYNCTNLKHAVLAKNMTNIGVKAFAACTNLKRASIPEGVTRLRSSYIGCTNLQSVVLSSDFEEIGDSTFMNCTSLEYVYNTSKLKRLGSSAFNGCSNLKKFTVPEAVKELPAKLFKNCKNAEITLLNNAPDLIGESCFENCEKITEAISFENVEELEPSTYRGCINLTEITFNFKENLKKKDIPHHFCYGCFRLKHLDLGTATSIGDNSFQNCAMLSEVVVPNTVTQIGAYAFYDCFRLGKIYVSNMSLTGGSWIEGILDSTNRTNWIDPLFTKVIDSSGVMIRWQPTTI